MSRITVAAVLVGLGVLVAASGAHAASVASVNAGAEMYGNEASVDVSPQMSLAQGQSPCVALPAKANVQSVLALVNVGVQDIPVLSNPQNQQCAEGSTLRVLSGNRRTSRQARTSRRATVSPRGARDRRPERGARLTR